MDKLILKSIEAIKDGKTEYAIGLLEGALEMAGPKSIIPIYTPQATNSIYPLSQPTKEVDEGAILDAMAAAALPKIKPSFDD